jgi:ectoine hydroxylase-related dioxygenase (phytanoyl-CoA dioxygenase family)
MQRAAPACAPRAAHTQPPPRLARARSRRAPAAQHAAQPRSRRVVTCCSLDTAAAAVAPPLSYDALRADPAALAAARSHYAAEGWLHVRGALSVADVAALHAATDALEARAAHLTASARVGGVFCEVQSASGRKREPAVAPGVFRKLTNPSKGNLAFAALRKNPALLFLASRVAGVARPRCAVDQVNTKHALFGTGFPWHQDASFLVGAASRQLAACGGANAVVALDASYAAVGGFEVLGRTHHTDGAFHDLRGSYDTATVNGTAPSRWDESGRHCPEMAPGDALLFSPFLAHGSGPNQSATRRRIATLWFVGTDEDAI